MHAEADGVEVVLLDQDGNEAERQALAREAATSTWRGTVSGVAAGQRYAYQVSGSDALLLDPWALAFTPASLAEPRLLHSLVVADLPAGARPPKPGTSLQDTVVYETHVKGLTRLHPDVPPRERGTYRGLCDAHIIEHFHKLGVTAVELLPVQQFVSEQALLDRGLVNYWGYLPLGWFAPHHAYSASGSIGEQVEEFRAMVDALHLAQLEVILDVVFNHTAEGGSREPPLSLRGLANDDYYWLHNGQAVDITGTGNTIDGSQPVVAELIANCLTYWATVMGVDGFRFDEASALARAEGGFKADSPLLTEVTEVARDLGVKLIAEPWDLSQDPFHLGDFSDGWSEWNGPFRDGVPRFWSRAIGLKNGDDDGQSLGDWLSGASRNRFRGARNPLGLVNFVACHDGLTTADKVAADLPLATTRSTAASAIDAVQARRRRRQRNLLATTLLARGVPMLLGGDEYGRTQDGNANAYDQDNPVSWYDWTPSAERDQLAAFVARTTTLRGSQPILRSPEPPAIDFLDAAGNATSPDEWTNPTDHFLATRLSPTRGAPGTDVLLVLNSADEPLQMPLPPTPGAGWVIQLDSSVEDGEPASGATLAARSHVEIPAESLIVLAAV